MSSSEEEELTAVLAVSVVDARLEEEQFLRFVGMQRIRLQMADGPRTKDELYWEVKGFLSTSEDRVGWYSLFPPLPLFPGDDRASMDANANVNERERERT